MPRSRAHYLRRPYRYRGASKNREVARSRARTDGPLRRSIVNDRQRLHVVDHPAIADRLARLRDRDTPTPVFRKLIEEVGAFLAYEATRDLPLRDQPVITPVTGSIAHRIATRPVVAPILRAGLGLLPGFLDVIDDAVVAHLGFYRDPKTLQPVPYYANVPDDLSKRHVFILDPMLATGNSGAAAIDALDERLNDHGYIVPGLGDAGDRMFGSTSSVPVAVRPRR